MFFESNQINKERKKKTIWGQNATVLQVNGPTNNDNKKCKARDEAWFKNDVDIVN